MKRTSIYFIVFMLSARSVVAEDTVKETEMPETVAAVLADTDQKDQLLGRSDQENLHYTFQELLNADDDTGIPVSINLSSPKDLNWEGALGVNGLDDGPRPIFLPFLPSLPIENFEVKFRFLKKKF